MYLIHPYFPKKPACEEVHFRKTPTDIFKWIIISDKGVFQIRFRYVNVRSGVQETILKNLLSQSEKSRQARACWLEIKNNGKLFGLEVMYPRKLFFFLTNYSP